MTRYVPQVSPHGSLQHVAHLLSTSRCDAVAVIDAQERLITMVDVVDVVALDGFLRSPAAGRVTGPTREPSPSPLTSS